MFGSRPAAALSLRAEGASSAAIQAETGCTVAVHNVSFTVEPEEIFVVMGLSGSGKSTLLRCLNRLVEPTRGTVRIGPTDVTAAAPDALHALRRSSMAMVFQSFGLFPHRSVLGNVAYGLEVSGQPKDEREANARDTLDRVGLADYATHRPHELSGGMQQRVGLARALATDPDVLLMDEAFSALDPLLRADMQDELRRLQQRWEPPCTIVFITHDLDEALALGDRIALMKDGAIVQIGTPAEILTAPADDYVRSFVETVDRTEVLTARAVLATNGANDNATTARSDGPVVDASTPIKSLLPMLLASNAPLRVKNGDSLLGVIDREAVLRVLRTSTAD